jgi:hypothetical protein
VYPPVKTCSNNYLDISQNVTSGFDTIEVELRTRTSSTQKETWVMSSHCDPSLLRAPMDTSQRSKRLPFASISYRITPFTSSSLGRVYSFLPLTGDKTGLPVNVSVTVHHLMNSDQ